MGIEVKCLGFGVKGLGFGVLWYWERLWQSAHLSFVCVWMCVKLICFFINLGICAPRRSWGVVAGRNASDVVHRGVRGLGRRSGRGAIHQDADAGRTAPPALAL